MAWQAARAMSRVEEETELALALALALGLDLILSLSLDFFLGPTPPFGAWVFPSQSLC